MAPLYTIWYCDPLGLSKKAYPFPIPRHLSSHAPLERGGHGLPSCGENRFQPTGSKMEIYGLITISAAGNSVQTYHKIGEDGHASVTSLLSSPSHFLCVLTNLLQTHANLNKFQ